MAAPTLPNLPRAVAITDTRGVPNQTYQTWWQSVLASIKSAFSAIDTVNATQDGLIADLADAVADIAAAQAAATAAAAAAAAAQADATDALNGISALTTVQTVTANYTALTSDGTILVDATAGPVTISLYTVTAASGPLTIRKTDASANAVTINPFGAEFINGAGTLVLPSQYDFAQCVNDGIEWYA